MPVGQKDRVAKKIRFGNLVKGKIEPLTHFPGFA